LAKYRNLVANVRPGLMAIPQVHTTNVQMPKAPVAEAQTDF